MRPELLTVILVGFFHLSYLEALAKPIQHVVLKRRLNWVQKRMIPAFLVLQVLRSRALDVAMSTEDEIKSKNHWLQVQDICQLTFST